ncbi:hypothetical protein RHGRI_031787 [Rhododendron griersonianum]|uniref:Uncharacterized protein n=1 Tax=Rhododendron griersonianum TaxID=479676 RepID=A0AAV6I9F2_9ERIC|nr:hypothetical protein RHGRI_031787 [Rhododendron griersonianum]
MDTRICTSLGLLSPTPPPHHHHPIDDFNTLFTHLNTLISTSPYNPKPKPHQTNKTLQFASTTVSIDNKIENPQKLTSQNRPKPTTKASPKIQTLFKTLTVLERSVIGAAANGIAGAFTYMCLHPLDTIKTKLQTKGASEIYSSALDAVGKTFQSKGILGFYFGVSAVIMGSTASSAVYFGTCEFGKSVLSKVPNYPSVLIPPTVGAMGNIISSAIMVPKELITERMQAGAKGRSWEVLLRILEKDGVLGLYAGCNDKGSSDGDCRIRVLHNHSSPSHSS